MDRVARLFRGRVNAGRIVLRLTGLVALIAVLHGCGTTAERVQLPPEYTNDAVIPGLPRARFWGDEWPKWSLERFNQLTEAELESGFPAVFRKSHSYLAISGGGANGAYGAGLLAGWTDAGTRPEFTMVTGISTGALTAPFAFLGSEYDDVLRQVYTTTTTADIAHKRQLLSALFSDSMTDTAPLRKLIQKYISEDVIAAIGREWRAGRRLWVGTVNLDAGRPVIWDIGRIAVSDHPRKIALIHDVLQASAAIPVAFPPVMIPVEANGKLYDEMHVDGGYRHPGVRLPRRRQLAVDHEEAAGTR